MCTHAGRTAAGKRQGKKIQRFGGLLGGGGIVARQILLARERQSSSKHACECSTLHVYYQRKEVAAGVGPSSVMYIL